MPVENDLISIEKKLWTGGSEIYRKNLDDNCLLAFMRMAGVSSREEVAGTVEDADRWRDLDMEVEGVLQPTPDVALLTYRASAVRGEGDRYEALVSSAYVRRDGAWKLMFHQQTPLASR